MVRDGIQAVTLRAIAREMGITAPALYRYYTSREDLVDHLRWDVCTDLGDSLEERLGGVADDDPVEQVLSVCRGFRDWALEHPQEFTLVFASPLERPGPARDLAGRDSFGLVFMRAAGRVLAAFPLENADESAVPPAIAGSLGAFRDDLVLVFTETGVDVPSERLTLGAVYVMVQFWVRLYGQVALEVFNQFPFPVRDAEPLFEALLVDLAREVGLT